MKNLFLLLVLVSLTFFGYFSNLDHSTLFDNASKIELISTNLYSLKYKDNWKFDDKLIKKAFIVTLLDVLTSVEIQSLTQYDGEVFGVMNVMYDEELIKLELGNKLFSDNGFYLKINNEWFVVKNSFSKDIVYKNNNDLASKQYDIIYNLFNFTKDIILKNTVNKS